MFSWSARMLSYNEPDLHHQTRALYFALASAQRLLVEAGVDVGTVPIGWMKEFGMVWQGSKKRESISSASAVMQAATYQFGASLPGFLGQVGTAEAWSTDFLTREQVHV